MTSLRVRRAVLYGRVSKAAPRETLPAVRGPGETRSVDQQLALLIEQARRESVVILGPYRDDGISASRFASGKVREGWQQTMEALVSGEANELWANEISRATRDRPVWAALIGTCIAQRVKINVGGKLHDPLDPDDGFMLDLQAALAVRESAVTSKRILRDVAARAAAGQPHGKIPYGYRREYDPSTGALLRQVPDPEQAAVLTEMAERILAGSSMYAIANALNDRGVLSPEATRAQRVHGDTAGPPPLWRPDEVRDQLLSPTVSGQRSHRGKITGDAAWPPIISIPDQDAVRAIIRPQGPGKWFGPAKHLLSGIAECGVCGAPLRGVKNRGYPSYACQGWARKGDSCVSRVRGPVDSLVVAFVLGRLADPRLTESWAERSEQDATMVGEVQRELAGLRLRLAAFEADAATSTGMAADSFGRVVGGLVGEIEAKERQLTAVAALPPGVVDLAGPDAEARWNSPQVQSNILLQRQVVRSLARVVLHLSARRHGSRGFDASSVSITAR